MQGGVKERGNWKGHSFGGDARRCVGNEVASGGVRSTWRRNILAWTTLERVFHMIFVDNLPNSMTKS